MSRARMMVFAILMTAVLTPSAVVAQTVSCFIPQLVLEGDDLSVNEFVPYMDGVLFIDERTFDDRELYYSDGSAAGTAPVVLPEGYRISQICATVGGEAYLGILHTTRFDLELWVLNGIGGEWLRLHNNLYGIRSVDYRPMYSAGNLFFLVEEHQLWRTDGSVEGTILLQDFTEAADSLLMLSTHFYAFAPGWLAPVEGGIVFSGADVETGVELWFSDGTPENTRELANLEPECEDFPFFPEYTSSMPWFPFVQDEFVYYSSGNLQSPSFCADSQTGIYRTDGTAAGTVQLEGVQGPVVIRLGDQELFADDGAIWALDAGASAARLVKEHGMPLGFGPGNLYRLGQQALYVAPGNYSSVTGELWSTDGTPAGTRRLTPVGGQMANILEFNRPRPFASHRDERAVFALENEIWGAEPWITDGTPRGTKIFRDLRRGPEGAFPGVSIFEDPPFAVSGDVVYFPGKSATAEGIWAADIAPDSEEDAHSADIDADFTMELSEVLRVVQLFNAGGYRVANGTEDGFAPGPGSTAGTPHDSDYKEQDWRIDIFELLRVIQFYNAIRCRYCVAEGTEDGFGI